MKVVSGKISNLISRSIKECTYIVVKISQTTQQSNIIYFTLHKCMFKNLEDYLGNKVAFVQVKVERYWIVTAI